MGTYIRERHLMASDLKRGPGKANEMIKHASFLIERTKQKCRGNSNKWAKEGETLGEEEQMEQR